MKSRSIGTRAESRWLPRDSGQSGFTLLEVLVALTLVLAFAAVLGPLMFHARRIMTHADDRVAAQILLRALLADPLDRANLADLARAGETDGLRWRITAAPSAVVTRLPASASPPPGANSKPGQQQETIQWSAYHIVASVSWAPGQSISGETIRLGKAE